MTLPPETRSSADDYFYEALPFVETHPTHLGAIGTLFGLKPAPPKRCRVLEIGTATGGNILPLAAAFPDSTFVAIDRAEASFAVAKRHLEEAALGNVFLALCDVRDFEEDPGSFDYIICHGVYSWVPDDAREAIRRVIRRHLAPHGVAYLSFNTMPGWHLRGAIRDMLLREVGREGTDAERLEKAHAFLRFLATRVEGDAPARVWLTSELSLLTQLSDHYLIGEHLAAHNRAEYLSDFARDMSASGLAFMSDAHISLMFPERLGKDAAAAIATRGGDLIAQQEALDLLELRFFRRALLCRDDAPLDRHVSADRVFPLVISSPLVPESDYPDFAPGVEETFHGPSGAIGSDQPLVKAALVALAAAFPSGLSFPDVVQRAAKRFGADNLTAEESIRLAKNLLGLYTKGALKLWADRPPITKELPERPATNIWARYQARAGHPLATNLLHLASPTDSFDRALLRRMDGKRTLAELSAEVLEDAKRGVVQVSLDGNTTLEPEVFLEIAEQKVARLARMGFVLEPTAPAQSSDPAS